jgi:hypothetical protein
MTGLEPALYKEPVPKTGASTNSATCAGREAVPRKGTHLVYLSNIGGHKDHPDQGDFRVFPRLEGHNDSTTLSLENRETLFGFIAHVAQDNHLV